MSDQEQAQFRRLLGPLDPANELQPLEPAHIERMIRMTIDTDHATTTPVPPARATHRRSRLVAGLAGAAALVAIAAGLIVPRLHADPATTALQQPAGIAAKCAATTPEALQGASSAYRAQVVDVEDGTVTLRVLTQYAGPNVATLNLPQGAANATDGGPLHFTTGDVYLLATTTNVVRACQSALASPELQSVYEAAFSR